MRFDFNWNASNPHNGQYLTGKASKGELVYRHRQVYADGYLGCRRLPRAGFDAIRVLI
jgi:hypothetical protein